MHPVAESLRPPYLDDADLLKVLDKSGVRVNSLFAELDRRTQSIKYTDAALAMCIIHILFERFLNASMEVAGYKADAKGIMEGHSEEKVKSIVRRCAAHLRDT
jgi:hypothetical protein